MTSDPLNVVRNLISAFNRRERQGVESLLHDEIVCVGIPLPPTVGKQATMDLLEPFLSAEKIDWQILAIAASGPVVLTERLDRFRFSGRDWTEVRACGVFELSADGRVRAWRDYFDMQELIAAMPPEMPHD